MQRAALALASLAVAAAACLSVVYALREPSAPGPVPAAPVTGPAHGEAAAAPANGEAQAPRVAEVEPDFVAQVARAEDAREQALRDVLVRIEEAEGLTLDAQLDRYREALKSARAGAPDAPLFADPSVVAEVFLRMESVQRELAALSPSARSRELANIRRELGFDEAAIARLEEVDERREARWQNGLAYMQERARLAATFEGDALDAELRELRREYFAHEAGTIEREEGQGFFRFERPRIYGRN